MYYLALAADYDGTIAEHSAVSDATAEALQAFKRTGRRLVLVTGRELTELRRVFPRFTLFDRIVAENGAVIYDPATSSDRAVAPPPPSALVQRLIERGVEPISVGHVIVATWHPHEAVALEVIRELGLELHIVFNKGAVMILRADVNKASGLRIALEELDISPGMSWRSAMRKTTTRSCMPAAVQRRWPMHCQRSAIRPTSGCKATTGTASSN